MLDKTTKAIPNSHNLHSTNTEDLQKYTELRSAYKNTVH